MLLQYCLQTRCANGLKTEKTKNIGAAIAPTTIAKGSVIKQHNAKHEHPLISFAKTQGDTIIPITQVKAIPKTSIIMSPTIKNGNNILNPTNDTKACPLDTSST